MNSRIASIENLIAYDPGGRNICELRCVDHLRLAALSLREAKRVGIVTGFFIPEALAGETDGPPGAKAIGHALVQLGVTVDYLTDEPNAPLLCALGVTPIANPESYLDRFHPTHLLAIERPGRCADGRYRNMQGLDISASTAPLDSLFLDADDRSITTIGIGDGGNEIGMGLTCTQRASLVTHDRQPASVVATNYRIAAGVSNWGALGLIGALSVLIGIDLLPSAQDMVEDMQRLVYDGGAVDGVTHQRDVTVDGLDLSQSIRMLENIRQQINPSPLASG